MTVKNNRSSKESSRISEEEQESFIRKSSSIIDNLPDKNEEIGLNEAIYEENEDEVDLLTTKEDSNEDFEDFDIIISNIGMGKFQKRLLVLCGFGWVSDAFWLVCMAIILPRVQIQFQVSNSAIGLLSSSQYFGMMIGAMFWGIVSDTYGRKQAFSWTLGVTVIFGFISTLSQSFGQLCFMFFMLGFGVGGNLPVDGAIFLEFVPKENQYLLTFSAVFFELGAVFTSFIGYLILPSNSCFDDIPCDVSKENNGWRYLIAVLGTITLTMFVIRILFFRLLESPRYLISQNRRQEAILVFQEIARINGSELEINLEDLSPSNHSLSQIPSTPSIPTHKKLGISSHIKQKLLPKLDDINYLFSEKLINTTRIVWMMWGLLSFSSVMFTIYLPKYLEYLGREQHKAGDKKLEDSEVIREGMKTLIICSIWGIPSAMVASYLVESFLGRKGTMAIAAAGASLSTFLFTFAHKHYTVVLFSMIIGSLKTINWSVIYCYTPEVFESKIRGTASGISSVCARITGMVSPIIAGSLISLAATAPLYATSFVFGLLTIFVLMLPIETRGRQAS